MARRDSNALNDLLPWAILSAPGSIYPQSIQAAHAGPDTARPDDFGGPLPWGCDQREPPPHDQA